MIKPAGFDKLLHNALKAFRRADLPEQGLLTELLLYQRAAQNSQIRTPRQISDQIVSAALQILRGENEEHYNILRFRFIEKSSREQVAGRLHLTLPTADRKQGQAINQLADIIWRQEGEQRQRQQDLRLAEFPQPSYEQLFGVTDALNQLQQLIAKANQRHLLVISGLGGIGKSSLADALARQLALNDRYQRYIWLRLPSDSPGRQRDPAHIWDILLGQLSERLAPDAKLFSQERRALAVQERLRQDNCFVVVDNIEMSDVVSYLVRELLVVAGASQFVLTSRSRPDELSPADVFELNQLTQADALDLLAYHLERGQPAGWQSIENSALIPLYELTGGNPMALILTAGLLHTMPLATILEGLKDGRVGPIESLYMNIYRAIWAELSQDSKDLLLAMLLVGADEGAGQHQLTISSGLENAQFWTAVTELRRASLLEARGNISEQRFGIHHLTQTFLRSDVL